MNNIIIEEMNKLSADGIDFVPICVPNCIFPNIIASYTKEEFKKVEAYPKSNRKYWKIINGVKQYL